MLRVGSLPGSASLLELKSLEQRSPTARGVLMDNINKGGVGQTSAPARAPVSRTLGTSSFERLTARSRVDKGDGVDGLIGL